jgi:hypothetical protein
MSRVIEVIRRGQRGLDGSVGLVATVTRNTGFTAIAGERGYVYRCLAPLTASFEPAAVLGNGWHCIIDAVGGTVTLDPNAAETINGAATLPVVQNAMVLVYSDGVSLFARWFFGNAYIALNGFPTGADQMIYGTGTNVWAETPLTAYARTLLDDATQAAAQTTLGMGMTAIVKKTASNSASLDFTEFDAARYDSYVFVLQNIRPATDNDLLALRTSSNGGSSYDGAGSYSWGYTFNAHAAGSPSSTGSASAAIMTLSNTPIGNAAGEDVSGEVRVYDPAAARRTRFTWNVQSVDGSTAAWNVAGSGSRLSEATVNAVQFLCGIGNIASGSIVMYGLRRP